MNEMLGWLGAPLDPPTDTADSVKECSIDGRRTLATIDEMLEDIHNHGFTDLDFSEPAVVANTPNDKPPLQANSSQLSEASNVSRAVEAEDICKYDSESGGPVLKLGEPLEPLPSEWSVTVEPLRIRKKKLKTVAGLQILSYPEDPAPQSPCPPLTLRKRAPLAVKATNIARGNARNRRQLSDGQENEARKWLGEFMGNKA